MTLAPNLVRVPLADGRLAEFPFLQIVYPDKTRGPPGIFPVHPAQFKFILGSLRRNQLDIGGRGSGKTQALIYKALYLSLVNPGCKGAICGRTFREAGDRLKSYWDEALRLFEEATGVRLRHSYSKSLQRDTLINDAKISFAGYDQVDKLRGDNVAWYCLDEIEFSTGDPRTVWDVLTPAVRQPGASLLQMAAATTPNGTGGIAGRFYRQQLVESRPDEYSEDEVRRARRYFCVRSTMFDNPWLTDESKDEIAGSLSGRMYRQEVLGIILTPQDSVFSEFDMKVHVIDWRWRPKLPYMVFVDWGTSHAYFCAVQLVDRDGYGLPIGTWVVAYEKKVENTSYAEFRREITRFVEGRRRKPRAFAADRAVKPENAWVRAKFGCDCFTLKRKNEQDIVNGIELVRYLLAPNEGEPRLYFSRQGLNTDVVNEEGRGILGSLVNYQYAKDKYGILTNYPLKDNVSDHPIDALRMGCVSTRNRAEFWGGRMLRYQFPTQSTVSEVQ